MNFNSKAHNEKIKKIQEFWETVEKLNEFAKNEYGIDDIFQDNEGKVLQQLVHLNFANIDGREGNDGIDVNGVEWEMKSVNILKTKDISTNHHLNQKILTKYRLVPWSFTVYEGIQLQQIYVINPRDLEDEYFTKWENEIITENIELNNPKIKLEYIKRNGILVYCKTLGLQNDPTMVYDEKFRDANRAYDFSSSNKRAAGEIISELSDFIKSISNSITSSLLDSNKIVYSDVDILFAALQENKDSVIVYLNIPNIEYDDYFQEIKTYKKKLTGLNCKIKQHCVKGDLSYIKDLIRQSYEHNKNTLSLFYNV